MSEILKYFIGVIGGYSVWNIGADYIFTHTCPERYIPADALLPDLNQKTVSRRMEVFLNKVEEPLSYKMWFCGHYHIDRIIDNIRFVYTDVLSMR